MPNSSGFNPDKLIKLTFFKSTNTLDYSSIERWSSRKKI